MHMDAWRGARIVMALAAFLVPMAQTAQAFELYARAIGEPYMPTPAPAPAADPPAPTGSGAQDLPGLGTVPPAAVDNTVPEDGGWSFKKILIGMVIVGAIGALASKGGGDGEPANPGTNGPPAGGGGGGTGGPPAGGGAIPVPAPVPTPDKKKDDDKDRGRDHRLMLPGFSASF